MLLFFIGNVVKLKIIIIIQASSVSCTYSVSVFICAFITIQSYIYIYIYIYNQYLMIKCNILLQTFEHIKLIQLEKYHKASTEEERNAIELDPMKVFHEAIENCKPLLITQRTRRGGITYTVSLPWDLPISFAQNIFMRVRFWYISLIGCIKVIYHDWTSIC